MTYTSNTEIMQNLMEAVMVVQTSKTINENASGPFSVSEMIEHLGDKKIEQIAEAMNNKKVQANGRQLAGVLSSIGSGAGSVTESMHPTVIAENLQSIADFLEDTVKGVHNFLKRLVTTLFISTGVVVTTALVLGTLNGLIKVLTGFSLIIAGGKIGAILIAIFLILLPAIALGKIVWTADKVRADSAKADRLLARKRKRKTNR